MTIEHRYKGSLNNPVLKDATFAKGLSADKKIYKYFRLKHVESMLQNKKLLINQVNKWDDVYENFLFKQPLSLSDGTPINWLDFTQCIYGQSWTSCKSSDAMWRIYSDVISNQNNLGDVGIRVQTSAKKLWDTVYTGDNCMANTRIGDISYLDNTNILNWLRNHSLLSVGSQMGDAMFESLLIKRTPFAHEKEVRILVMIDSGRASYPDFLSYDIDPDLLFEEFVIEPRISDQNLVNTIITRLKTLAPNIPVRQSSLYQMCHQVPIVIN